MGDPACYLDYCPDCDAPVPVVEGTCPDCGADIDDAA
jgi:predicted amidophosphoribosyltransferase